MNSEKIFICDRCKSDEDVAVTYINDLPKTYCVNCRAELFSKKNKVGRPSIGITKKVSITMSDNNWNWLDENSNGNKSKFIKDCLVKLSIDTDTWDNEACMGYAIISARNIGFSEEQIKELITEMKIEFDWKTINQAKSAFKSFTL